MATNWKVREENMRRIIFACALAGVLSVPAKADETLKWRHVHHATSFQTQQVGDVDGHTLSLFLKQANRACSGQSETHARLAAIVRPTTELHVKTPKMASFRKSRRHPSVSVVRFRN
jgi:hypothetical protein